MIKCSSCKVELLPEELEEHNCEQGSQKKVPCASCKEIVSVEEIISHVCEHKKTENVVNKKNFLLEAQKLKKDVKAQLINVPILIPESIAWGEKQVQLVETAACNPSVCINRKGNILVVFNVSKQIYSLTGKLVEQDPSQLQQSSPPNFATLNVVWGDCFAAAEGERPRVCLTSDGNVSTKFSFAYIQSFNLQKKKAILIFHKKRVHSDNSHFLLPKLGNGEEGTDVFYNVGAINDTLLTTNWDSKATLLTSGSKKNASIAINEKGTVVCVYEEKETLYIQGFFPSFPTFLFLLCLGIFGHVFSGSTQVEGKDEDDRKTEQATSLGKSGRFWRRKNCERGCH